ncbi:MAG TPA: hypothetical protein DEH25_12695 [Chloroflexi bacterium]|nr:hypothetical protein [Chloroflexota bacterium]HBY09332.1 hypothetical protein [Chloroflexota bacterium]
METAQVFRPTTIPRTGERNAWILSGFAIVIEVLMIWRFSTPPAWITILTVFLLLSATLISLSNWVDRKTTLILQPDGVEYRNGLRNVHLQWDQIEKVRVAGDRWGQRVHVWGMGANFNFRLLSEVEYQGKVRGQMGFPEGETILKKILKSSGLSLTKTDDQDRYYARP